MSKHFYLATCALVLFVFGCGTSSELSSLPSNAEVVILPVHSVDPPDATFLRLIKFTQADSQDDCGYNAVMGILKEKARKLGGNVIQLTELTAPENWQYCYNATAYVYFKTDIKPLVSKIQQRDSVQRVARNLNPKEATLYLYREKSPIGEPIKYTVQAGDAEYIAKNASKKAIKLTKEGKLIVKANDKLITLDVKMGEAYYLKCGLRPSTLAALGGGVLINVFPTVPTLKIMPFEEGETEYKKLQTQ